MPPSFLVGNEPEVFEIFIDEITGAETPTHHANGSEVDADELTKNIQLAFKKMHKRVGEIGKKPWQLGEFHLGFERDDKPIFDVSNPASLITQPRSKDNIKTTKSSSAQELLNSKNVTFAQGHASGIIDSASAKQNIVDAASGRMVSTSHYGTAPKEDIKVELNPKLIAGLLALSKHYKMSISEIAGGSHTKPTSNHYRGISADINIINGEHVTPHHPDLKAFMADAAKLGFNVGNESNLKHGPHIHLDMKK